MLAHRYTRVQIRSTETGIRIETQTTGGNQRTEEYAAGDAADALTRSGISAYLNANSTLQADSLAATLNRLNEVGWTGTGFDSDDGAPEVRVNDAREAAGLGKLV